MLQVPPSIEWSQVAGLLVLGFGGHARSVIDVAISAGCRDFIIVESNARPDEKLGDTPINAELPGNLEQGWFAFSATGDNKLRQRQLGMFAQREWPVASVISPNATLGVGSRIESGCFVAHHAHIGPMARIGAGCIVNTACIIEHECVIGEFSHVSVNSTVAGRSRIGAFCMVGAGATVIDGIEVVNNTTIGAGAVVKGSITESGVYVGVPAKRVGNANVSRARKP